MILDFFTKRKIIYILISLALIVSLISLFERWQVERENKEVELVLDIRELDKLNEEEKKLTFTELKESGLSGIAVFENNLNYYISNDKLELITGETLKRRSYISNINDFYKDYDFNKDSAFLITDDQKLIKKIESSISKWQEVVDLEIKTRFLNENKDEFILFFPEWNKEYGNLSLGFDKNLISEIRESALKVIPRVENDENDIFWDDNYDQLLLKDLKVDYTIFAGDTISGYDNNLLRTAEIMNDNDINFGMIESFIASQRGSKNLAHLLEYDLLRVHSIQAGEMEKYSMSKIVDRYIRAVRERNVRILYLKPFLSSKEEMSVEKTNKFFLSQLTSGLEAEGFNIADAKPYKFFANSNIFLYLIALGIIAAGIILLEKIFAYNLNKFSYFIFVLGFIVIGILIYLNKVMFLRKILALGSSVIFPSLAVITQLIDEKGNCLLAFIKVILISFVGVVLSTASLSHLSFLVNVDQFRGIKIAFVLPIIIALYYYFRSEFVKENNLNSYYKRIKEFLDYEIKIKDTLLVGFIGVIGIVYILRSGNISFLSISNIETWLREGLEDILYVRPRFKAFLIGYPILLFSLYYREKIKSAISMILAITLSTIAPITLSNTFAHIHTPLMISLLRAFHGIWLGVLIACFLILVFKFLEKLKGRWLMDD